MEEYKKSHDLNGWSKYEMAVLQRLEDHTRLLQNLTNETNSIKQQMAISDIVAKNWRESVDKTMKDLKDEIEFILDENEQKSLTHRVMVIEEDKKVENKASLKLKAFWGIVGGGVIILIDIFIKTFDFIAKRIGN